MLALGGRALRDGARRFAGSGGAWRRGRGLKSADISAGGKRKGSAQQDRRSPKAAAHPGLAPSRTLCHDNHSYWSRELILAKQLNLPHPERFDPWAATQLDPATDPNPFIF